MKKNKRLYYKMFKQGLIFESDVDELSQSLMNLFEEEISKKEKQLNQLNQKKESLQKGIFIPKEK